MATQSKSNAGSSDAAKWEQLAGEALEDARYWKREARRAQSVVGDLTTALEHAAAGFAVLSRVDRRALSSAGGFASENFNLAKAAVARARGGAK